MKEKRQVVPVLAVLLLVGIWYMLIGKDIMPPFMSRFQEKKEQIQPVKKPYKALCSEANLARMLVLSNGMETKVKESAQNLWYIPYYEVLSQKGYTALKVEDAFNLVDFKTLYMAFSEVFSAPTASAIIEEKEKYEIYEVIDYLEKALAAVKKHSVQTCELVILATPEDEIPLMGWQAMTTMDTMNFEGLVLAPLKNQTITVAICQHHILGVKEVVDEKSYISNCEIIKADEKSVTYKVKGLTFTYANKGLSSEMIGRCLTLCLKQNQIIGYQEETEEAEEVKTTIRVVLTDGQGCYEQDEVILKAEGSYEWTRGEEKSVLSKGQMWRSKDFQLAQQEKIVFVPKGEGTLQLASVEKSDACPSYYGTIEVTRTEKGFVIVNEVDMEHYVAGVLLSEMPANYGEEALKAQAVAARTYGASCLSSQKFKLYGADVDDTTASQVYNRVQPDERANQAAQATSNLVLKADGRLISDKFFAASCGYTANYGEVWMAQSEFPTQTPNYLKAQKQYEDVLDFNGLSEEDSFRAFIKLGAEDLKAYDEDSPWFRWEVSLTKEALEALVLPNLKALAAEESKFLEPGEKEGSLLLEHVTDIEVVKRGEGGNAMALAIKGDHQTVKVLTEYGIRSLFASQKNAMLKVKRADGSVVEGGTLLPSAFFMIESEKDASGELLNVKLVGGGCGHGVGLSQEGARKMAGEGYTYEAILAHYYPGSQIVAYAK